MKTLDEVIEEVERCRNNITYGCGKCPEFRKCFFCVSENPTNDPFADALHYLEILKAKSEEPPLGEPPDYIPLDFHQLAEMIGEPVYIKDSGCRGHWEIVIMVRKTADGEDVSFRGYDRWQRVGKNIYRTKKGAEQ